MREDHSRNLHTDADVYTVGLGWDVQFITDGFHPFASAAADRHDTLFAVCVLVIAI